MFPATACPPVRRDLARAIASIRRPPAKPLSVNSPPPKPAPLLPRRPRAPHTTPLQPAVPPPTQRASSASCASQRVGPPPSCLDHLQLRPGSSTRLESVPIVNQVPPGNSGSRARRSTAPLNDSGSRKPVPILPFLVWPAAIHLPVGLLLSPIREAIRKPVATGRDRGSPPLGSNTGPRRRHIRPGSPPSVCWSRARRSRARRTTPRT